MIHQRQACECIQCRPAMPPSAPSSMISKRSSISSHMISDHDIIYGKLWVIINFVMSYMISHMISLYLDPLFGPLPAENDLQGRKSDPKFRLACFDQHVQFCPSLMILLLWPVVLCSSCVSQVHFQASKGTQVPRTNMCLKIVRYTSLMLSAAWSHSADDPPFSHWPSAPWRTSWMSSLSADAFLNLYVAWSGRIGPLFEKTFDAFSSGAGKSLAWNNCKI